MPSKMASKSLDSAARGKDSSTFVNDYLADWDDDDPFRSPSPDPARNDKEQEKKKDVLGIEQQLDLKRKPRAPRVKLDETRLLSDKGIPKLRKMAPRLKLKGKGHEFDDAARLLSFYQDWLDDLFPKANFLDALAMVEKTGHKGTMRIARQQWIDEGKPRAAGAEDDEDYRIHQGHSGPQLPNRVAPIFDNAAQAAQGRAKTPSADDLFGDDDIYNATPRQSTNSTAPSRQVASSDVPDEDDLDALMAEAEAESGAMTQQRAPGRPSAPFQSIFGGRALHAVAPGPAGEPGDDDDLDALMAEAEAEANIPSGPGRPSQPAMGASIFGDGKPKHQTTAQGAGDDEDDLDALMAEAEAEATARPSKDANLTSSARTDTGQHAAGFEDDEEAMAEMDGLW